MFRNLATYPKLVGGIGPASRAGRRFYASVLDADMVAMSTAEAAEFSKLADTTYRDVNIALANEFAQARMGVDVQEVIAAANTQPYSHIHQPGLGVGGHCIPVYPHFLLSRAPGVGLVETAREVNDGQSDRAVVVVDAAVGGLAGAPVLVLGLTYREGVKELAYSRAIPLIEALTAAGAEVWAFDPLMDDTEVELLGARPWLGDARSVPGGDHPDRRPAVRDARSALVPGPRGRVRRAHSLRALALPDGVAYVGVGVQAATRAGGE